jgi:hypothetical protein
MVFYIKIVFFYNYIYFDINLLKYSSKKTSKKINI